MNILAHHTQDFVRDALARAGVDMDVRRVRP